MEPSFVTGGKVAWALQWKPMPMQFTGAASVSVVASAAVDPERPKNPMLVVCRVARERRAIKVQALSPGASPRQQARPGDRWSAAVPTAPVESASWARPETLS
jgi:hypothetical protein